MALEADILGATPERFGAVFDLLLEIDRVAAFPEAEAFLDHHAVFVRPGQRYHELVPVAKLIRCPDAREHHEVGGFGTATGCANAGFDEPRLARAGT